MVVRASAGESSVSWPLLGWIRILGRRVCDVWQCSENGLQYYIERSCLLALSYYCKWANKWIIIVTTLVEAHVFHVQVHSPSIVLVYPPLRAWSSLAGKSVLGSTSRLVTCLRGQQQPSSQTEPRPVPRSGHTSAAQTRQQSVLQLRRRPLLGPSLGWKRLPVFSHLRHYSKWVLMLTQGK